jgi:hypothetical protein
MATQNIDDPIRIRLTLAEYDSAKEYWDCEKATLAGKIVFEKIGNSRRPRWAARILKFVSNGYQDPLVNYVLEIAVDSERWHEGREVFRKIREQTLKKGVPLLSLAEKTAKIIYNATEPPAPFDWHTGWSLCEDAFKIAQNSSIPDFSKNLWILIAGDRPEQ